MKKLFLLICLVFSSVAQADLFSLHLIQDATGINATHEFTSVLDLFNKYEKGDLSSIEAAYSQTKKSTGYINFRGIQMKAEFLNDAGTLLRFTVPDLSVDETFTGSDQKSSFKALTKYLKENQDNLLKKILKASVSQTPYDLVAGNPTSMMAMMTDQTYARGHRNSYDNSVFYLSPNASRHQFKFQGEKTTATVYSLPFGYTFNLSDNGWALLFDMPITYADIDGSKSYAGQLGLGLKIPLAQYWALTPSIRGGAIGSKDMLSGGVLYSGALTSDIRIPVEDWEFGLTNMVSYIRDFSIKVADYDIAYDLKNVAFKNGIDVSYRFSPKYSITTSYAYTVYTGDKLFIDSYHDVGLVLTRAFEEKGMFSSMSLVGNYTFDDDNRYQAFHAGIRLSF